MIDEGTLDPADVAPLIEALRASTGDARSAILEALSRLPLAPADAEALGIDAPSAPAPLRPAWADGEPPGFSTPRSSGSPEPDTHLTHVEPELAPAAVTQWFAQAIGDRPDLELGDGIVAWIAAYPSVFRPDLEGLYEQYRRAALAEYERAMAALLIADAADCAGSGEPPFFAGGHVSPESTTLRTRLRRAARAGVVPVSEPAPPPVAEQPSDPMPPPAAAAPPSEPPPAPMAPPAPAAEPRRPWPARGTLVALAVLGGLAILKWVLGWLSTPGAIDVPRLDDIQCTVFAPPAARPGSTILVQVFAHVPTEADDARAIASELDTAAVRRVFHGLDAPVPVGSRLDFELRMPGLEIDDQVASMRWQGRTEAVQFGVSIAQGTPPGKRIGTVSVSRDGLPLGHLKFALEIGAAAAAAEPQGIESRRYRYAFVSYASLDRDEVLRRVQMLSITGLRYFQDVLDLEPGERWSDEVERAIREADVFLLFWSSRAKASEWVRREVDFALACQEGDELSPPEIRPVIIEGPPVIAPWEDLAHLHFNDRVLYFMSR